MLVRLVYASKAAGPINNELVNNILTQSRKYNAETGITGVLCVCHGNVFLQVLEGSRVEVNRLYAKLARDTRHTDVTLLDYAEITERRFYGWRMGRVDLDKLNVGLLLKYSETPVLDPFNISGKVAMALLEELMSTASIMGGN
jgi:hypothetical protein